MAKKKKKLKVFKLKRLPKKGWVVVGLALVFGALGGGLYATNRNPASNASAESFNCPKPNGTDHADLYRDPNTKKDCVMHLQHMLNIIQYFGDRQFRLPKNVRSLKVDGYYGSETANHIFRFAAVLNPNRPPGLPLPYDHVNAVTWANLHAQCHVTMRNIDSPVCE